MLQETGCCICFFYPTVNIYIFSLKFNFSKYILGLVFFSIMLVIQQREVRNVGRHSRESHAVHDPRADSNLGLYINIVAFVSPAQLSELNQDPKLNFLTRGYVGADTRLKPDSSNDLRKCSFGTSMFS